MQVIGSGIFTWSAGERQSRRYGTVFLTERDLAETVTRPVWLNTDALSALEGLRVRLTAGVIESRPTTHLGDQALQVFPGSPPAAGTRIEIGVGRLFLQADEDFPTEQHPTQVGIGLAPSDGRHLLWLDPAILYQLYDQTVELFVTGTSDPETPPSPLVNRPAEEGVFINPDGRTFQVSGASLMEYDAFTIRPEVKRVPGGFRLVPPAPQPGKRVDAIPRHAKHNVGD
jgi:hypothetical protein